MTNKEQSAIWEIQQSVIYEYIIFDVHIVIPNNITENSFVCFYTL